ncbi:ParA family protein [Limibacter armeniacum]|uniref:ParA family protein n=1 Tax=Limibacter armeniacum TaxID=466084 RepID=UPI002FE54B2B
METLIKAIAKFIEENPVLNVSGIEIQAGVPKGTLQKALGGFQKLSQHNAEKLMPVLTRYGFQFDSGAKIISIANNKGGVAKTASTVNIAAAIAKQGLKTLIIDMDPQGSASRHFGQYELEVQLSDSLRENAPLPIEQIMVEVKENLWICPSNLNLEGLLSEMQSDEVEGNMRLKKALMPIAGKFDYIFIDCPPSLNLFTINSLIASNGVLVPVQPEPHSIDGIANIMKMINKVAMVNPILKVDGFFFTLVKTNTKLHEGMMDSLQDIYPNIKVYQTRIRHNISISEASYEEKDVLAYDSSSAGAKDYTNLSKELING